MNSMQTTDDVCIALRTEAASRGERAANANVADRSELYHAMTFEVLGISEFRASTNRGTQIDLIDLVLDHVEEQHQLVFMPHHDGGGQQTIHWSHA